LVFVYTTVETLDVKMFSTLDKKEQNREPKLNEKKNTG